MKPIEAEDIKAGMHLVRKYAGSGSVFKVTHVDSPMIVVRHLRRGSLESIDTNDYKFYVPSGEYIIALYPDYVQEVKDEE